jgi:hypothetical protein
MQNNTENIEKDFNWLRGISDRNLDLRIQYIKSKQSDLRNEVLTSGIFQPAKSLKLRDEVIKAIEEQIRRQEC